MNNKLIEMFEKYAKKKRLDKFSEYIKENNLEDKFVQAAFLELFQPDKNKDYTDLIDFVIAISNKDFETALGKETSDRLLALIKNNPMPGQSMMYLKTLRDWVQKQNPDDKQGVFVEEILDAFSQEGVTLGIHKIGTSKRRNIKRRRNNTFWTQICG